MRFVLRSGSDVSVDSEIDVTIDVAYLAGYTGRDQEAVKAHIDELAAHGIAAPGSVPAVYPVPGTRVVSGEAIHVCGSKTAGEAEFVMFYSGNELLIGVGSDHTDRELEAHSVLKSKQTCDKPVCRTLWRFDDIGNHFDELLLRAHVRGESGWHLYQEGSVASMLTPHQILDTVTDRGGSVKDAAVFSGTVPIIGGDFRYGTGFRATLEDPVLNRSLVCDYTVSQLPDIDT